MKSAVRRYDSVGRYGGEEFLIVLPGCDRDSGIGHAERMREAVASEPFQFGDLRLRLTCSIGVAAPHPGTAFDTRGLVRAADLALYRAKNRGRDCVEGAAGDPPELAAALAKASPD